MAFRPADWPSLTVFMAIVAFVIAALLVGTRVAMLRARGSEAARHVTTRVAVGIALWLFVTSIPVFAGVPAAQPFPRIPLAFAAINLSALSFGLSSLGGQIARHLPLWSLVVFQGFRLPLELVLHRWAEGGMIPTTMTWSGSNLDIVSGIVALGAAPFVERSRTLAWIANLVGIALLVNVGRVEMKSSPLPFAWNVDPPLQLILYLPYALIGTVCVAGALAGHVILTRRLLMAAPPLPPAQYPNA